VLGQPFLLGLRATAADDLARKAVREQAARGWFSQPPTAKVEQHFLVELADGSSVGALHVVGQDLELWLGVYRRLAGEQQIAVRLLSVRLLRFLIDDDFAVEDRSRRAIEYALRSEER